MHITRWLNLFAILALAGGTLAACVPQQKSDFPLQPTLSLLQTKAAGLEKVPEPSPSPTNSQVPVPLTGTGETPAASVTPPVAQEPTIPPTPLDESPTSAPLVLQPSPTIDCPAHEAEVTVEAPRTALKVGEAIEVKVTLRNTGCVMLGLPQYRLAILNSEGKAIFSPDKPEPVIHSKGIDPGASDEVTFLLQAASPGKATLTAMASFEVHLGYPGPAYWGAASSKELVIQVEP